MKIEEIIAKISEGLKVVATADNVETIAEINQGLADIKGEYGKLKDTNQKLTDKMVDLVSKYPVDLKPTTSNNDDVVPKTEDELLKECFDKQINK